LEIIVAPKAGFCFGVKAAIDKTFRCIQENPEKLEIYTYGPLIHNNQVIEKLKELGVKATDDIGDAIGGILIIRSHGVPLEIYERAKKLDIKLVDATCPFVRNIQKIAHQYHLKGYKIVIVGNPNHPEVIGINGWCNNEAVVLGDSTGIDDLEKYDNMCVVAQTTLTKEKWDEVTNKLLSMGKNVKVINTICLATKERQEACEKVAREVDYMIVIGGYHSSNTQKLLEICQKNCNNCIHIETAEDLPLDEIEKAKKVGITAGASTPDWVINEVIKKLESKGGKVKNG